MRLLLLTATAVAMMFSAAEVVEAGHGCRHCDACGQNGLFGSDDCGCGHGWGHGCGLHGRRCIEGLDWHFNCSCRGSYNYPVPPLYTYHWPGMFKQVRMTDYVSPWRFPPIRPYTEEKLEPLLGEIPTTTSSRRTGTTAVRPVSNSQPDPKVIGEVESVSSRLRRTQ